MIATLFMLMSLDGKISTGVGDERDFDKDLPKIPGTSEGLNQYYALEQQTDLYSFNTGKVMAKVGWNEPKEKIDKIPVTFVIVDNLPHLTEQGVKNLLQRSKGLIIVTTNNDYPALEIEDVNLELFKYTNMIDFKDLFSKLTDRGIERMTIQSGGDMNATLIRDGLVDELSLVIAPALVGGKETPSLIGGESILKDKDLSLIKALELIESKTLKENYINLRYRINN